MAIGITYKSAVYQSTNTASTFAGTPTWTPAANSLLVCFVCTAYSASPTDPSGVSGHGVSYSKLTLGTSTLSTTHQLSIWVAKAGASPTSAAPTATVTSTNGTGDLLIEFEVTGHDNSGTALQAIVASTATNSGASGTSATVTLSAAGKSTNRAMTFVVQLSNNAPTAAGTWQLTSGASGNFNTPATGAAAMFDDGTGFNTAGAATVASGASWRMVGIEIKCAIQTHTNTGTPAADASTVAGTARNYTLHTSTGALSAQAATIAGTANSARKAQRLGTSVSWQQARLLAPRFYDVIPPDGAPTHTSTGTPAASSATVAGTATHKTLHASTGAPAAQAATLAGTAVHKTRHAATGTPAAQSATLAATAVHKTLHATTGALAPSAATLAGTAAHQHRATGALAGQSAAVAGAAVHRARHATTGALSASASTAAGTAQDATASTGALSASAATAAGTAAHHTLHATTGALSDGVSTVAGSASANGAPPPAPEHPTTGALAAGAATVSGSATHQAAHASAGSVAAGSAAVAGTARRLTIHATTGALAAGQASAGGDARRFTQHNASGALAGQAAAIVGDAIVLPHGAKATDGALAAGPATVSASAARVGSTPSGGGGGPMRHTSVGPASMRSRGKHGVKGASLKAQSARVSGIALRWSPPKPDARAKQQHENERRKTAALMALLLGGCRIGPVTESPESKP